MHFIQIPKLSSKQQTQASRTNVRQGSKSEEETSAIPSAASPAVLTATAPRTTTDKRRISIDAALPHSSTQEPAPPKPVASRTDEKKQDEKVENSVHNDEKLVTNGHNNNFADEGSVLTSPGSEYWLARNPVADQVFITDVTVNLKTVTIRECKTEKGFFKEREDQSNPSDVV